jgi:hypothetical protein
MACRSSQCRLDSRREQGLVRKLLHEFSARGQIGKVRQLQSLALGRRTCHATPRNPLCACLTPSLALTIANRKSNGRKRITDDMKVCSYKDCRNPRGAKHYFHINKDKPPKPGRCLPDFHSYTHHAAPLAHGTRHVRGQSRALRY